MFRSVKDFANAIRVLSADMVNEANSGHQGMALGFADVLSVLLNRSMNFAPGLEYRDRLVLSAGHASAMLYSAIYLTKKTPLTLDNLRTFRKFGSICQGHPEIDHSLGVEMTTGALGQGVATSVGMAIALKKKHLDSKVFVIVGDGDLMEGVSHEAMSFASALALDNLIVLFDDNNVCMDGHPSDYTTSNIERFKAYGFEVLEANGHDYAEIWATIEKAKRVAKPVFISFKTVIGYPSSKAGTSKCHGQFEDSITLRKQLGFSEKTFEIPEEIFWKCEKIENTAPAPQFDVSALCSALKDELAGEAKGSTRALGGKVLSRLSSCFDKVIGGSADLSGSNCTLSKDHIAFTKRNYDGNYIHYGIREHAMGCIMNGLAIEGLIPYGGTFLVFSDYMRPAIRNAALMKVAPIFVLTHDSVAVGEDGATHQPIEQIDSLRLIPELKVMRPACVWETIECVELACSDRTSPTALVLSRQNLQRIRTERSQSNLCKRGMYELIPFNEDGKEKLTIIATGSEVMLANEVRAQLPGFDVRIVSAPCLELFDRQSPEYKAKVLEGRKLFLEAGTGACWHKYRNHPQDLVLEITQFGESGTAPELFRHFGFTAESIVRKVAGHK